jgi:hypothetical protein
MQTRPRADQVSSQVFPTVAVYGSFHKAANAFGLHSNSNCREERKWFPTIYAANSPEYTPEISFLFLCLFS